MSTTITYKGNTLTTLDNETKTLKTSGKYMEDDLLVSDAVTKTYTATISSTGNSTYCYVMHNNETKYYTSNDTFEFEAGDSLYCYVRYSGGLGNIISVNNSTVAGGTGSSSASYTYTMPAKDIRIRLTYSSTAEIAIIESIIPSGYVNAITYTPTATAQTIYSINKYYTGNITINGDEDLVANNIKNGVNIFGVTGTYESGGGGIEYETGTWIPTTDVSTGSIPFTNSHTTAPFYYAVVDAKDSYDSTTYTNIGVIFTDWSQALGCSFYGTSTYIYEATANIMYRGSGMNLTTSNYWFTSDIARIDWVSNVELKPQTNSTSRYWRAGRTYKWIAIWAPTT